METVNNSASQPVLRGAPGLRGTFLGAPRRAPRMPRNNEYPELYRKALAVLLPFVSTYSCETGFSAYVAMKTKYRNCLDARPDLRLKLSSLNPNIEALCTGKTQYQPSH
ncbi:hypothetical protein V9T40_014543 [Parthenolecanium corni]|uniref:HAT C-terminal dimerisation domain-containing protein n=1 Tax=Parthenolecanium corni TaxID=536013 RepID=A0AAN9T421_9HEMI